MDTGGEGGASAEGADAEMSSLPAAVAHGAEDIFAMQRQGAADILAMERQLRDMAARRKARPRPPPSPLALVPSAARASG